MKKIEKFEAEIIKVGEKKAGLNRELAELRTNIAEKERLIFELMTQKELEDAPKTIAELEKEIVRLQKEVDKLKPKVGEIELRIKAIDAGKVDYLRKLRDEAKIDYDKEADKLFREREAKLADIKQLRAHLINHLVELREIIQKGQSLKGEFVHLSGSVDNKYDNLRNPAPHVTVKALQDNYDGDHAPILPNQPDMYRALEEGRVPQWFDYWKLTGEILSQAQLHAKQVK